MAKGRTQQRIELPPSLGDGKVIRGKDGWLFLDNDSNRVIAQHAERLAAGDVIPPRTVETTRIHAGRPSRAPAPS